MLDVSGSARKGAVVSNGVVCQSGKAFALAGESAAWQLGIHINNMKSFYTPGHESHCTFKINQILEFFDFLIKNDATKAYLGMETRHLLGFRCAQLIQHYGAVVIQDYIKLVYGKKGAA